MKRQFKPWSLSQSFLRLAILYAAVAGIAGAQPEIERFRGGGRGGGRGDGPRAGAELVITELNPAPTSQGLFTGHWTAVGINHDGRLIRVTAAPRWLDGVNAFVPMDAFSHLPLEDKDDDNFKLAGPAGILNFNPSDDGEESSGVVAVTPNAGFRDDIRRLYALNPSAEQWLKLILYRIDADYLDLVSDSTRPRAGLDEALRLAAYGVPAEYVAGVFDSGRALRADEIIRLRRDRDDRRRGPGRAEVPQQGRFSPQDLIRMRNAGVSPEYIQILSASGPAYSVEDIILMRNSGVAPEFLAACVAPNVRPYSAREIIAMRNAGVQADFFVAAQRAGAYSGDELILMRNAGVTTQYLDAAQGWTPRAMSAGDFVQLRNRGVQPAYLLSMRGIGRMYTAEEMLLLQQNGITADYIVRIERAGEPPLTVPEIIRIHDRQYNNGRRPPFDSRGNR